MEKDLAPLWSPYKSWGTHKSCQLNFSVSEEEKTLIYRSVHVYVRVREIEGVSVCVCECQRERERVTSLLTVPQPP